MTWHSIFSIMGAVILANLIKVWRDHVKDKRAARTEIPAYRNWRGEYVPDLHLIRARRLAIVAFIMFAIGIIVLAIFLLDAQRPA